jgi:hypothetical protein
LPLGACWTVTMVFSANSAVHVPLVPVPLNEQLIPAGILVMTPVPAEPAPGATVSRSGAAANPAVTALVTPLVTGSTHVPPVQLPVNPSKLPPPVLPATRVTVLPAANDALHTPLTKPAFTLHEMPEGELVTLPLPVPVPLTVTMPGAGTR